jgi:hypothetical protein
VHDDRFGVARRLNTVPADRRSVWPWNAEPAHAPAQWVVRRSLFARLSCQCPVWKSRVRKKLASPARFELTAPRLGIEGPMQYSFQLLHSANVGIRNISLGDCAIRATSNRTGRANNTIGQP